MTWRMRSRVTLAFLALPFLGKAAPDHRLDRGVGLCHCGEHLTSSVRCFDIAEADFEMPLTVLTAPNES